MDALVVGGMLATPFVDFALYATSSFVVSPQTFAMTRQVRALREWHGNVVNYALMWYLLCYRLDWDAPRWSDAWMVPAYVLIVDGVFYGLHRACHRFWYYPIHQRHHLCQPIGAHCARHSHWLDATLENLSFFAPFFVLSFNAYYALACLLFNSAWASYIHTYPTRIVRGGWLVSPYLHWIHHQSSGASSCNYALYCTVWDRLLGTLCEDSRLVWMPPERRGAGVGESASCQAG